MNSNKQKAIATKKALPYFLFAIANKNKLIIKFTGIKTKVVTPALDIKKSSLSPRTIDVNLNTSVKKIITTKFEPITRKISFCIFLNCKNWSIY